MNKKIIISENEKSRILNMHYKHYKNSLVNEQEKLSGPTQTPKRLPCAKSAEEIESGKAMLYVGCKNDFVKEVQERLATAGRDGRLTGDKMIGEKGAWENPTDGIFGNRTRNAVVEYQKEWNLYPDGTVGKKTWEKIKEYEPKITYNVEMKSWVFKRCPGVTVATNWNGTMPPACGYEKMEPIQVTNVGGKNTEDVGLYGSNSNQNTNLDQARIDAAKNYVNYKDMSPEDYMNQGLNEPSTNNQPLKGDVNPSQPQNNTQDPFNLRGKQPNIFNRQGQQRNPLDPFGLRR